MRRDDVAHSSRQKRGCRDGSGHSIRGAALVLLLMTPAPVWGQGRKSYRRARLQPGTVVLRSAPEPLASPRLKAIMDQERARIAHIRHRGPQRIDLSPQKRTTPTVLTLDQDRALARTLFSTALTERLQQLRWRVVAAPVEGAAGMHSAPPDRDLRSIVATAQLAGFTLADTGVRTVSLHFHITLTREGGTAGLTLPAQFTVAGTAESAPGLFKPAPPQPVPDLVRIAVVHAAAKAAHALRTGEVPLLEQPGATVAVLSVTGPRSAAVVRFTPGGRTLEPSGVPGLPKVLNAEFEPDLGGIDARKPRTGDATGVLTDRIIGHGGLMDTAAAKSAAMQIGAAYVLAARVIDVQIESGPREPASVLPPADPTEPAPGTAPPPAAAAHVALDVWRLGQPRSHTVTEREARAEAVSVLIRAADGAVVWSAHASETMAVQSDDPTRLAHESNRALCNEAEQFALLEIRRQFNSWLASFER